MNTEKLEAWISKRWATDKARHNPYADDGVGLVRSEAACTVTEAGAWVWVCLGHEAKWDQDAPWHDYSSWEEVREELSWIGPSESAPETPTASALSAWAVYAARYFKNIDKCDARTDRTHEGERVVSVSDEGRVAVQRATGVKGDWTIDGSTYEWTVEDDEVQLG